MSKMVNSVKEDNNGYLIDNNFWIASENEYSTDSIVIVSPEEALRNSEEILQLKEGCSYEYEILDQSCKLVPIPGIIHQSRKHPYRGRITPGNYVGRLPLNIRSPLKNIDFAIEVRSSKANYRSEYRKMLEDITSECTELMMIHSSPVTQTFSVDFGKDSQSLYQRFSFVQSMVDSEEFYNAIQRVISSPITRWKIVIENRDSRRVKRITSSQIRQLSSGNNRIPFPEKHPLSKRIGSIPRQINSEIKTDTLDNPENRFIKHTLREFARFSGFICQKIDESNKTIKPNVYFEAKRLEEKLSEWLSHNIFREVSQISTLPLNNPVLQRKEGYREIFRIWLMYDLAAKLTWDGLDNDTYNAGKRDVSTLYEYWLFFKLLRMIENIFSIEPTETKKLIKKTNDGLGLQLKAGIHTAIEGFYKHKNRNLKIKYNYNRTFSYAEYPNSGSWSQKMRPDYTLSFWPADFSEKKAEELESIVHIHFDAKYKVDDLKYLLDENNDPDIDNLNSEKDLEKTGRYKRADLLKMHAYKDAIRRTAGAYIIYPGSESITQKGFHELIPGLGAFAVSPSNKADGIEKVKEFIINVLDHFTNRNTQRETHSFYTHKIMKTPYNNSVYEKIPEYTINTSGEMHRVKPVTEINVLIGFVQEKQKNWIVDNGYYNIRMDEEIKPEIVGADYLLLYDKIVNNKLQFWRNGLFKIQKNPVIKTKEWLLERKYPDPSMVEYFVYKISPIVEEWSSQKVIEIYLKEQENRYRPITRTLPEVMN
ncbi:MAG: DUF2357 domain-containing protein [Spirochaetales bacterium]|nr:DUF2357 domain-containing protein [Spirochaetales bacterium]